MITQEQLKAILNYDPESGELTWKQGKKWTTAGSIAGGLNKDGYWSIMIDHVNYSAHRLAWLYMKGQWPSGDLDHKNLIRSDNRFENLREATRAQNMQNGSLRTDNKSGYRGVSFHTNSGSWRATIRVNGTQKHLGLFATPEQAARYRDHFARECFGEFFRSELEDFR